MLRKFSHLLNIHLILLVLQILCLKNIYIFRHVRFQITSAYNNLQSMQCSFITDGMALVYKRLYADKIQNLENLCICERA